MLKELVLAGIIGAQAIIIGTNIPKEPEQNVVTYSKQDNIMCYPSNNSKVCYPVGSPTPEVKIEPVPTPAQSTSEFYPIYKEASDKFGVPWQILEAVHQVETGKSGDTEVTSYAGAQGPMQFMPRTWDAYKEDGDGDGVKSRYDVHDAIYGAAKLLAAGGAAEGRVRAALWNYNHSDAYVDKVVSIAQELGYNQ